MRHQLVDAIVTYRRKTGQRADTWSVTRGRQMGMLELLRRATQAGRRMTKAELARAQGVRTSVFDMTSPVI